MTAAYPGMRRRLAEYPKPGDFPAPPSWMVFTHTGYRGTKVGLSIISQCRTEPVSHRSGRPAGTREPFAPKRAHPSGCSPRRQPDPCRSWRMGGLEAGFPQINRVDQDGHWYGTEKIHGCLGRFPSLWVSVNRFHHQEPFFRQPSSTTCSQRSRLSLNQRWALSMSRRNLSGM